MPAHEQLHGRGTAPLPRGSPPALAHHTRDGATHGLTYPADLASSRPVQRRADRRRRLPLIYELTPDITHLTTVRTDVQVIESGEFYEHPDQIDRIRSRGIPHPGEQIHQAWAGEQLPISKRPDDAKKPAYGDRGIFLGQAAFYSVRYGDYLIGMNAAEDRHYKLNVRPILASRLR